MIDLELQRAFAQSTKHIGYMPLEEEFSYWEGKGEGEGEGKDGGGEEARGVAARREMTSTTHGPGSDLETQDFDQIMPQCRFPSTDFSLGLKNDVQKWAGTGPKRNGVRVAEGLQEDEKRAGGWSKVEALTRDILNLGIEACSEWAHRI
ncbi:hypothetical protein BDQ17DRAFT_1338134 [Cyathus striatus]|nr:hypothetical protein BDQ17DRAFT_1338134 [Cyathus striatus]